MRGVHRHKRFISGRLRSAPNRKAAAGTLHQPIWLNLLF
ncbi:hypothetical protein ASZ90_010502 [hydrocarbon metagenome]|uniref:Uncharacterized protein n=1 Tax=hydrocarbon metagenome TaxID=938273 RepID=A0A0W8FFW2_9ZZZZ